MLHITVADNPSSGQDAFDVLVGYKNEVSNTILICVLLELFFFKRSPQLWKLTLDQNTSHQLQPTSNHLQPFNEFRGPGYFVGPVPQMISCVANGKQPLVLSTSWELKSIIWQTVVFIYGVASLEQQYITFQQKFELSRAAGEPLRGVPLRQMLWGLQVQA